MNNTFFEEPVTVLVGLGFPRQIESAIEAYQLLSDMQLTTSKAAQKVALQACKAAIDGKIDPETARSAFMAFARRSAMLLSNDPAFKIETDVALPSTAARSGRGETLLEARSCDDLKPISA
jgi:Protein of unknown function (DUF982)